VKKTFFLIFIVLLFTACPWPERTIESVIYYTIERNFSSHNVFIQYYLDDEIITRKLIRKGIINDVHSGDNYYQKQNKILENNYCYDPGPDPSFIDHPNKSVKKILIIDIDTHKILKCLEKTDDLYFLDHAKDNYDMRARFEYWMFDITDEWLNR
jgi:hypothetical protein